MMVKNLGKKDAPPQQTCWRLEAGGQKTVFAAVGSFILLIASSNILFFSRYSSKNAILLSSGRSSNVQLDVIKGKKLLELVTPPSSNNKDPSDDFVWSRYCKKGKSPCIALLSAAHHGGVISKIDPKNPTVERTPPKPDVLLASNIQAKRILMREGYCAMYGCDVVIDYNDYRGNRTMWLSDHGKHKVGRMPPHWNKVAALQRWLPHFDAILQLDMDTTWVDFNTNVYDLYNSTSSIYVNRGVGLIMIKRMDISHCIVDSWWYHGTSPGCRYFKYPENHMGQTQNLDMPWFWYSLLKCTSEFSRASEPFECLNTCNGPAEYVDHLMKDPDHDKHRKLWIYDCYNTHKNEIIQATKMVQSNMFNNKHINLEMQWGNSLTFQQSIMNSISVHCKDRLAMVKWLNETAVVMHSAGCTDSCAQANVELMYTKLNNWSNEVLKWECTSDNCGRMAY